MIALTWASLMSWKADGLEQVVVAVIAELLFGQGQPDTAGTCELVAGRAVLQVQGLAVRRRRHGLNEQAQEQYQ